jgi:uncharacterized damage-inducible protein DinB
MPVPRVRAAPFGADLIRWYLSAARTSRIAFSFYSPSAIVAAMNDKPQSCNFANQLLASKAFFERSTSALDEADSGFRPQPEMMTVAEQVAHVAQTLDWFIEGASRPEGFDLNIELQLQAIHSVTSLTAARQLLVEAFARTVEFVQSRSAEQMAAPLPAGPVMGGQPISDSIWGIVEHTAHHRGALSVYCRQLGKVPPMPYGG